jgi:hypothetical protein
MTTTTTRPAAAAAAAVVAVAASVVAVDARIVSSSSSSRRKRQRQSTTFQAPTITKWLRLSWFILILILLVSSTCYMMIHLQHYNDTFNGTTSAAATTTTTNATATASTTTDAVLAKNTPTASSDNAETTYYKNLYDPILKMPTTTTTTTTLDTPRINNINHHNSTSTKTLNKISKELLYQPPPPPLPPPLTKQKKRQTNIVRPKQNHKQNHTQIIQEQHKHIRYIYYSNARPDRSGGALQDALFCHAYAFYQNQKSPQKYQNQNQNQNTNRPNTIDNNHNHNYNKATSTITTTTSSYSYAGICGIGRYDVENQKLLQTLFQMEDTNDDDDATSSNSTNSTSSSSTTTTTNGWHPPPWKWNTCPPGFQDAVDYTTNNLTEHTLTTYNSTVVVGIRSAGTQSTSSTNTKMEYEEEDHHHILLSRLTYYQLDTRIWTRDWINTIRHFPSTPSSSPSTLAEKEITPSDKLQQQQQETIAQVESHHPFTIVVHIRRGDVNPCIEPNRYLPNSHYISLIEWVLENYYYYYHHHPHPDQSASTTATATTTSGTNSTSTTVVPLLPPPSPLPTPPPGPPRVIILTEPESFEPMDVFSTTLGYDMRTNGTMSEAWTLMSSSQTNVVILSKSSFSLIPAVFKKTKTTATMTTTKNAAGATPPTITSMVVYTPFWHQPLPGWTIVPSRIVRASQRQVQAFRQAHCHGTRVTSWPQGRTT